MRYGDIELRSGRWKWSVSELRGETVGYVAGARPAGEADPASLEAGQTVLLLEDPQDPEHWMTRELPEGSADQEIAEEELRALAANPDRRSVQDREGTVWTIEPIDRPESVREDAAYERAPRKARVVGDGHQERMLSLPDDRPLGALTREELIDLVRD